MRYHKKLLSMLLVLVMLPALSINTFAKSFTGDNVFPGLSSIRPDDTLTLPKNTIWATLTACWGVRVIFVDWDETELKSELVPVTDTTPGSSSAPDDPTRSGYRFTGWERYDTNGDTNVTLHDDGNVTGVTGPGPIIYKAAYVKRSDDVPTTGTITVINTTHDNDYAGYKIFDAEINPGNFDAIIYTITEDSPWYEFVKDFFELTEYRKVPGEGEEVITVYKADPKEGFDPKTFFESLPTDGITPELPVQTPDRDGVIRWEDVPFGYYAITSTLGSWATVNTNNPNVIVIDKNKAAVIDKNIIEDGNKVKTNSASFGENVSFDIDLFASDFKANELVTYYHIKDTISDGFDYDFSDGKNVTVKVTGTQNGTNGEDPYEFTLSSVSSLEALQTAKSGYYFSHTAGSRSFDIIVKWATLNEAGKLMPVYEDEFNDIHVTYSATVNDSAVIVGSGNPNTASFTYDKTSGFDPEYPPLEEPPVGTNPEDPNTPVTTTTYVYALGIEKVDGEDHTKHLPGVKFTTADFRAKKLSDGVYEVIPVEVDDTGELTTEYAEYFEVPESGFILIKGLGAGEYTFYEIETLPGYNLLAEPLVITIPASGETVTTLAETPCAAISTVENSTGVELPSTGGIGTTVFTVFGMIAMLGAGILLITNKRITKEEQ